MENLNLINSKEKHDYINFACDCGKLTANEFGLYVALLRFVNETTGYAYPKYEHLMQCLNITSRNTLSKQLKILEDKGFIVKIRGTQGKHNSYYFVHPNDIDLSKIIIKNKDENKINNFKNKSQNINNNTSNVSSVNTQEVSNNNTLDMSNNDTLDISSVDTSKKNIIKEYKKEYNNKNIIKEYNEAIPDGIEVPSGTEDKDNNNVNDKMFNDYYKKFTNDEVYNEISIRDSIITNILKLINAKRTEKAETNINNFISMYENLRFYFYDELIHNKTAYLFPEYGLNQKKEKLIAIKKMLVKRARQQKDN